jgi:hypothetical protein
VFETILKITVPIPALLLLPTDRAGKLRATFTVALHRKRRFALDYQKIIRRAKPASSSSSSSSWSFDLLCQQRPIGLGTVGKWHLLQHCRGTAANVVIALLCEIFQHRGSRVFAAAAVVVVVVVVVVCCDRVVKSKLTWFICWLRTKLLLILGDRGDFLLSTSPAAGKLQYSMSGPQFLYR